MTSIIHSTGVIVPQVVNGYEASREARTVVNAVLNRSNPDVTLRDPGPRSGSLALVFATENAAQDAFAVLGTRQVFTLADPDRLSIGMSFVVADGDLTIGLDADTREVWIVTVPFVEVLP